MVQRDDSGAPLLIEWSRLFDAMIVALAAPLAPWLGWHRALHIAGVATGPLSAGFLSAALAFAVAPITGRGGKAGYGSCRWSACCCRAFAASRPSG